MGEGKAFVDTNILVYAHETSLGTKHSRARQLVEELWQSGTGVLSTQVLQELCVTLRRRASRPLTTIDLQQLIADYMSWEIVINDASAVVHALEIEDRYKVSFWDALILHASEAAGVDVLYSEDLSNGQKFGSVRVVNPFKSVG